MEAVTVHIDDIPYMCTKGERLMDVLARYGVLSSPLCHHPQLKNITKAHMCFVELAETERPVEACHIFVDAAMTIKTQSEAIESQKKKYCAILMRSILLNALTVLKQEIVTYKRQPLFMEVPLMLLV